MKSVLSVLVAAAILVSSLPAAAASGETSASDHQPVTVDLHASITRSAARLAGETSHAGQMPNAYHESAAASQGGGGGGHAGMMVMMLVGVAASVGGGYLIYKQMKKQTSQAAK